MFERLAKYWYRPAVDSKAETGMAFNFLCAPSVCSVCLGGNQLFTTETQRTRRVHREIRQTLAGMKPALSAPSVVVYFGIVMVVPKMGITSWN